MNRRIDALGPSEAARIIGVSPQRIQQLAREGRISCIETSLGRLYERHEIDRLIAEREARKSARQ